MPSEHEFESRSLRSKADGQPNLSNFGKTRRSTRPNSVRGTETNSDSNQTMKPSSSFRPKRRTAAEEKRSSQTSTSRTAWTSNGSSTSSFMAAGHARTTQNNNARSSARRSSSKVKSSFSTEEMRNTELAESVRYACDSSDSLFQYR